MKSIVKNGVAAIVVCYFPEDVVVVKLLKILALQVEYLILVDNGGALEISKDISFDNGNFSYINLDGNKGLGYALNVGFKRAVDLGVKYVATFDQDSAPSLDLIENLLVIHDDLRDKNVNCAAVAPVFYDRREATKIYFPFYYEKNGLINSVAPDTSLNDIVEVDVLITSGMLVRIDVWSSGISYDEGLFVDYTDTEWCFRVRSKGYKLFGCLRVEMGHAPSDAPPARVFGLSFFRYSPLRRYYYFRNSINFIFAPYVSDVWKRRLLLGLFLRFFINLVIDKKKFLSLKMMIVGIKHGFNGKNGEFIK